MLNAEFAPSGKIPVIIDNEFGGVIFHEACGHGLEATAVAKKASVFADKLGEQVCSPLVTAIDDGTIKNAWGSLNIDDEGTPTQRNVLIENGVLKNYLIDKLGGRKMGMDSTGSARRESYRFAPTSRMTNTYIDAGTSTPEEIIANTEYALYAKYMGGGSVNPATGDFNFVVREGYIVRNGKIENAGERRGFDRQRDRCTEKDRHGRQQPRSRARHVRFAERFDPGKRGPADDSRVRIDGRRTEGGVNDGRT